MPAKQQKVNRSPFNVLEACLALLFLFVVFRFTAAVALFSSVMLYFFLPLHGSRRAFVVAWVLVGLALLIPVDIYVPGFHGQLYGCKHSGPRFVRVVYGMPMIQGCLDKYGEFISGGCVVGIHDSRWSLVWD